jgi:hypothetical protein
MTEQIKTTEADKPTIEIKMADAAAAKEPAAKTISHPRDVATLVLTQINQVNARKDELTIAIKALSDLTQQLATSYGKQMMVIEQLARRVNALEGKTGAHEIKGAAAQDKRVA